MLPPRRLHRRLVARVGVPRDADAGIVRQHALEADRASRACRRPRSPGRHAASCRCRRRRRDGSDTHDAPLATFSSAFRIGQSAIASLPSRILSVSRNGDATLPVSRWSRPMTIGAESSPLRHEIVDARRRTAPARPGPASRCAPAAPGSARVRAPASIQRRRCASSGNSSSDQVVGAVRCPRDRPRARPSGTAPSPRRRAGGCTPARTRECRTRRRRRASKATVRMLLP